MPREDACKLLVEFYELVGTDSFAANANLALFSFLLWVPEPAPGGTGEVGVGHRRLIVITLNMVCGI